MFDGGPIPVYSVPVMNTNIDSLTKSMNTKFTKYGPGGLSVRFDSTEIFPEDPGQGTPVLVFLGNESATFCCALNEGEVDGIRLSPAQTAFLETLETLVWDFTSR